MAMSFMSKSMRLCHRVLSKSVQEVKITSVTSKNMSGDSINTDNDQLPVLTRKVDKVFVIEINRPEKRNCVNSYTGSLLLKAFEDFEKDDSLKVAILHGKGGNFCAGFDLGELSSAKELENSSIDFSKMFSTKRRPMGPTHLELSKPTIAAVSGYAVAGGLELALLCDLRIVEDTAVMGVFCRRFGVPLIDGGTVRLPQVIGLGRALDLILTGRAVHADEALQIGLANRVVACGTALGQALNLANSICKFPEECMKADRKSAIKSMTAKSHEEALEFEWDNGLDIVLKESIHGASTFVQGVGRHGKFNLTGPSKL